MKQDETFLQEALAIAGIGCWEWNLSKDQLTCSEEVYRLFGLEDTTTGKDYRPLLALVHEQDLPSLKQAFAEALQNRTLTRTEFCITRPDGTTCTLEVRGKAREDATGNVVSLTGTLQDVSVHKEAQKELLKSERQYHFITEAVPAMVWTGYSDDKKDYVNTWMIQYTGLPGEKLLGEGWLETLHPDDREPVVTLQASSLKSGEPYQIEVRFRRVDGSYRWHLMHALPYQDEEGKLTKWIGINVDIHEQKLKEEALLENKMLVEAQQKLKAEKEFSDYLLESSIYGILAFNSQGRITKWNKHMEYLSGRKREEVLGKSLLELFPEYEGREEDKAVRQALGGEKVTLRRNNTLFGTQDRVYEINLVPLVVEGESTGGLGIIYEVTQIIKLEQEQSRRRMEGQKEVLNAILRAQERERERISELLHNGIGQLLFALKLNLQIVQTKGLEPETQDIFSRVNNLLNEAIRQSRTVSFELVPTILKDFGLEATLEDLAKILSSPALTIYVQVEGIEKRLEKFLELTVLRIIQALLSNVMEHSGATEATVHVSKLSNSISILVADNGKGFDPATARATVKENSLQTVSNRVALLNGQITIDSAKDKGTRVSISLPLPLPPQT